MGGHLNWCKLGILLIVSSQLVCRRNHQYMKVNISVILTKTSAFLSSTSSTSSNSQQYRYSRALHCFRHSWCSGCRRPDHIVVQSVPSLSHFSVVEWAGKTEKKNWSMSSGVQSKLYLGFSASCSIPEYDAKYSNTPGWWNTSTRRHLRKMRSARRTCKISPIFLGASRFGSLLILSLSRCRKCRRWRRKSSEVTSIARVSRDFNFRSVGSDDAALKTSSNKTWAPKWYSKLKSCVTSNDKLSRSGEFATIVEICDMIGEGGRILNHHCTDNFRKLNGGTGILFVGNSLPIKSGCWRMVMKYSLTFGSEPSRVSKSSTTSGG